MKKMVGISQIKEGKWGKKGFYKANFSDSFKLLITCVELYSSDKIYCY